VKRSDYGVQGTKRTPSELAQDCLLIAIPGIQNPYERLVDPFKGHVLPGDPRAERLANPAAVEAGVVVGVGPGMRF